MSTYSRQPTTQQLLLSVHNKVAAKFHAINEMGLDENRPTLQELVTLRANNPILWNTFPEKFCIDYTPN